MIQKKLSVIMPAYNEQDAILKAVEDIVRDIFALNDFKKEEVELIVVNDGSKDKTGEILDALTAKFPQLIVDHQKNSGHGGALYNGISKAQGEFIFLIDSDRQIPTTEFEKLWRAIQEGSHAATGVRKQRRDPLARLLLTRVVRFFVWIGFGVYIYDANVPFKIFRRDFWQKNGHLIHRETLAPSLFLSVLLKTKGVPTKEIEVTHLIRSTGVGSLNYSRLIIFCSSAFRQLLEFRKKLKNE